MEKDEDIYDGDHELIGQQEHASPVLSPPSTKKPGEGFFFNAT